MSEEEAQFAKAQQNTDLVSGQHQVVRMSGQRHTTTTIFENQSHPFPNDHQMSSATIPDQQAAKQQRQ